MPNAGWRYVALRPSLRPHVWFNDARRDLTHILRRWQRAPGTAVLAILTLSLGIVVNAVVFGVVNALMFSPLPVPHPEQIAVVANVDSHWSFPHAISYADYLDYRERNEVFSGLVAQTRLPVTLSSAGGADRIWVSLVSGNYFQVLGVSAVLGRTFLPEEDTPYGSAAVVVLSHGTWRRRFGGDPSVVGRVVNITGRPHTIVGVLPPAFSGTFAVYEVEAYVPASQLPAVRPDMGPLLAERSIELFSVLGRVKDGLTVAEAQAAMKILARAVAAEHPRPVEHADIIAVPELQTRPEPSTASQFPIAARVVLTLTGIVLLIACANVAHLLIVQVLRRRQEIAVKIALGASRARVVREIVTEGMLIALVGGFGAIAAAAVVTRFLSSMRLAEDVPLRLQVSADWRVVLFSCAAVLTTGVLASAIPALHATRFDAGRFLNESTARGTEGRARHRLRNGLAVFQIALSFVLLIASALFVQSLREAERVPLGFRVSDVLMFSVEPALLRYDESQGRAFYRKVETEVRQVPGVRSTSWALFMPFTASGVTTLPVVPSDGAAAPGREPALMLFNLVGPDYFDTLGTPIVRGRAFRDGDVATSVAVAVISEGAARQLWPGRDPIGRKLVLGGGEFAVVGVAADARTTLPLEHIRPCVYLAFTQQYVGGGTLFVRTAGRPEVLLSAVRTSVSRVSPDVAVSNLLPLERHIRTGIARLGARVGAAAVGSFGVLAFVLVTIGLYGLSAFSARQRQQELAIRAALGATPTRIFWLAIKEPFAVALAGLLIGWVVSVPTTHLISALLIHVTTLDPVTSTAVAAILLAVALVAAITASRRARVADVATTLKTP